MSSCKSQQHQYSPQFGYVKWPGGKAKQVPTIAERLPSWFRPKRLIEPFVGSGAVALGLGIADCILSDANPDLIQAHTLASRTPEDFIAGLRPLFGADATARETYDRLCADYNASIDPVRRAHLLVYLNRHCFNGLVRYSKRTGFNSPVGSHKTKPSVPEVAIRAFAANLSNAKFICADFRGVMTMAREGDLVYADPPYVPRASSNFSYTAGGFGSSEQLALADAALDCAKRGALVIISNHDLPFTRQLYASASTIHGLEVARPISCKSDSRTKVGEIMAVYLPYGG